MNQVIAVAVATVAGFAFGAVYYTALGKPWLAAVGKTEEEIKLNRSATPFVVSTVGLLVMAYVISVGYFGPYAEAMAETYGDSVGQRIGAALAVWFGFVVTTMATNDAFEGNSAKLTVINAGHWLGVLLIQNLVFVAF